MAQEYTLSSFQDSDFKDQNGNTWCTALFEEKSNEPIKWVVKDPTKVVVGQKYFGEVKEMTSKAGKPYLRFFREKNPDYQGGGNKSNGDGQHQGMCFNNASAYVVAQGGKTLGAEEWADAVFMYARALYNKGSLKAVVNEIQNQTTITSQTTKSPDVVAEVSDDEINLDDIPF